VPDTHARPAEKRIDAHRMVVRRQQSVIVGCKAVLPKLPSVET
jgi:hypothetical protein